MGYVRTAGMSTAQRRARRRTALVITGLLGALAVALLISLATVQGWFGLGEGEGEGDQAATTSAAPAAPTLEPGQVGVSVLNATSTSGLAGRTAEALRARGFDVGTVDNADAVEGAGLIRHGPEGQDAAELLAQSVGQDLELVLDTDREGDDVVLVLGPDWQELPTPDEAPDDAADDDTDGADSGTTDDEDGR